VPHEANLLHRAVFFSLAKETSRESPSADCLWAENWPCALRSDWERFHHCNPSLAPEGNELASAVSLCRVKNRQEPHSLLLAFWAKKGSARWTSLLAQCNYVYGSRQIFKLPTLPSVLILTAGLVIPPYLGTLSVASCNIMMRHINFMKRALQDDKLHTAASICLEALPLGEDEPWEHP